jgi:hypothetical protein
MAHIEFPAIPVPGFKMRVEEEPGQVTVTCSGILDVPDVEARLGPPLMRLHEHFLDRKVGLVRLDLVGVEYMNSYGIKVLASWFYRVENKRPSYAVEVLYDPASTWQRWSLKAVQILAPSIKVLPRTQA